MLCSRYGEYGAEQKNILCQHTLLVESPASVYLLVSFPITNFRFPKTLTAIVAKHHPPTTNWNGPSSTLQHTPFRFMGYGRNGTVFSTIGRHLDCAIQTGLVVELELALMERKQSR